MKPVKLRLEPLAREEARGSATCKLLVNYLILYETSSFFFDSFYLIPLSIPLNIISTSTFTPRRRIYPITPHQSRLNAKVQSWILHQFQQLQLVTRGSAENMGRTRHFQSDPPVEYLSFPRATARHCAPRQNPQ